VGFLVGAGVGSMVGTFVTGADVRIIGSVGCGVGEGVARLTGKGIEVGASLLTDLVGKSVSGFVGKAVFLGFGHTSSPHTHPDGQLKSKSPSKMSVTILSNRKCSG